MKIPLTSSQRVGLRWRVSCIFSSNLAILSVRVTYIQPFCVCVCGHAVEIEEGEGGREEETQLKRPPTAIGVSKRNRKETESRGRHRKTPRLPRTVPSSVSQISIT